MRNYASDSLVLTNIWKNNFLYTYPVERSAEIDLKLDKSLEHEKGVHKHVIIRWDKNWN